MSNVPRFPAPHTPRCPNCAGPLVPCEDGAVCLDCTSYTLPDRRPDASDFAADMEMEVRRMTLQRLFKHTMGLLRMTGKPDKYAADRVPLGIAVKVCKAEWERRGLPQMYAAAEGLVADQS